VEVTLHNRKKYKATVVGTDQAHDLAVIQIKAPDLVPAVLGDSRNLQVGQKVYAIGNPFGLAGTMTRGIVSSIRPVREPSGATIGDAIQTDAAINPGNSGGPLMNWHGEVIGINTMILSQVGQNAGIGFAIPINTAKAVLNDLMTLGRVRRPALGVVTIPISADLADEMGLPADYGLLILQVTPGGAADQAGLRGGEGNDLPQQEKDGRERSAGRGQRTGVRNQVRLPHQKNLGCYGMSTLRGSGIFNCRRTSNGWHN
jgi:S1-C subfamily serine protease